MTVKDPTSAQILDMLNDDTFEFANTGGGPIAPGTQPWSDEANALLYHLSKGSAGFLQVRKATTNNTTIAVLPGRCTINGTELSYAGGTVDLAAYNNDTAYVWVYVSSGVATIGKGADGAGWPGVAHIKLAEVTLSGGDFTETDIIDRRPAVMITNYRQSAAVAKLTQSISSTPTQTQVTNIQNKINELIQALIDAGLMAS
ncbi:MAG: hypothetical protein GC162_10375 [Planctomycetes bacterium]|nr:hypothetical protein [Planctomycetota bacterium]